MAKVKDYDGELNSLLDLIEQAGAAKAEDIGLETGEPPKNGFWQVDPPIDQRSPGTTLAIVSPDEGVFRFRIPKQGCTADTLRIFTKQAERYGFDFAQAREEQKRRALDRQRRAAEDQAARELALHARQAASTPTAVKPFRKRKKWPNEQISSGDINPSVAQVLLGDPGDGTLRPRPIYLSNVERFERIIKNGLWLPDYMHVDWFGFLLNGRHRLTAIINLGVTLPCKIIYGADPKSYASFDTPKVRSGADTLVISGAIPEGAPGQAHKHMSAALKVIDCYKKSVPWGSWGKVRLENDELPILVERYPLIYLAMEMASVLHSGKRRIGQAKFRPSPSIVFCYLALERYPGCGPLMDQFLTGITFGEGIDSSDPRRALYNLMRERTGEESGGETIPGAVRQLALLLKAWRQYCTGYRYKRGAGIGWRKGERMPQPVTHQEITIDIPEPAAVPVVL